MEISLERVAGGLKGKLSLKFQKLLKSYENLAYTFRDYVELLKMANREISTIFKFSSIYREDILRDAISDFKNAVKKLGKAY